jgi:uncharacterized protein
MSQENVDLVRAMFDAYLRHDDRALLAFADPAVEVEPSWDAVEMSRMQGHDAFIEFWYHWESQWDDYFIEPREFHGAGDAVVVVIYERGRGRRSGAVVEDLFAHVWTVREGKVIRGRVFPTRAEALAAAGIPG